MQAMAWAWLKIRQIFFSKLGTTGCDSKPNISSQVYQPPKHQSSKYLYYIK
jgi:hypothetical protein